MRQYAQEIGDRFVASLTRSYGDAYTFLRTRSNVARWSPEHIVVLRDRVEHAYQAGRISAETMEKACQLIASLVGDYDDPKTDEIAPARRPSTIGQIRGLAPRSIAATARATSSNSVPVAVRPPAVDVDAIAREAAPETVLIGEAVSASPSPSPPGTSASQSASSSPPVTTPPATELPAKALPAPARPHKVVAGATLAQRYVLEKLIGIGGTALVYQARDLASVGTSEHRIAVKLLHPELQARPQAVERFVHQFRQQQKLSHAGVARVFDLDVDAGSWFITMELLEGETLLDRARHGVSHSEALRMVAACGDALAYAHRCGVVHGDLKPSNIFLLQSGAVRLLDFGGAVEPRATGSASGDDAPQAGVAATPAYASPEVLAGECPSVRDDVFSLACIAHELLTGQHRSTLDRPPAPSRTASSALSLRDSLALSRGMAWQRMDRPETVTEFLRLLLAPLPSVNAPALVSSSTDTAAAKVRTQWQRHGGLLGFGLWSVGCLLALLSFAFGDPEPLRPPVDPGKVIAAGAAASVPQAEAAAAAPPTVVTPSTSAPPTIAPAPALDTPQPPTDTWTPAEPPVVAPASPTKRPPSTTVSTRRAAPVRAVPVSTPTIARAAGSIGLERRQLLVSAKAVAAVITLKRTGSTSGRARVRWTTVAGTAKSAQHYQSVSAIAEFADGQEIRTLFVPIVQQASNRSARTFSVALQRAPGGPPVGPVSRTTVTILGDI